MPLFRSELTQKFAVFFLLVSTIIIVYPILFLEYLFSPTEYLPYFSAVIEELVKCSLIFYFINKARPNLSNAVLYGLAVGGGYGFIENIIYAMNYLANPYFSSMLVLRFTFPLIIHINASVVFATLSQKRLELVGLIFAIIIHMFYNIILLA